MLRLPVAYDAKVDTKSPSSSHTSAIFATLGCAPSWQNLGKSGPVHLRFNLCDLIDRIGAVQERPPNSTPVHLATIPESAACVPDQEAQSPEREAAASLSPGGSLRQASRDQVNLRRKAFSPRMNRAVLLSRAVTRWTNCAIVVSARMFVRPTRKLPGGVTPPSDVKTVR